MTTTHSQIAESKAASCCICAGPIAVGESVVEERPTGESWDMEEWYYCVDCWLQMRKLRQREIDPEILLSVLEL